MTFEEIDGIIADIYADHQISQMGFDPIRLAKDMGYLVIPYSDFPPEKQPLLQKESADGFSVYNPRSQRCEIFYNDQPSQPGRIFFTIPHEIGHIELGHIFEKENTEQMEFDANRFARKLYVPHIIVIRRNLTTCSMLMSTFSITYSYASVILRTIERRKKNSKNGEIIFNSNELRLYKTFCYYEELCSDKK